jgi:hypothetical protein
MKKRCLSVSAQRYSLYGGRGIKVCQRWLLFENFLTDMGWRPAGLSLDRIDCDGDYTPENCRWATQKEQMRNMRITRRVTIEGVTHVAADLSDRSGLKTDTIVERAEAGLSLDEVLAPERRVFTKGLALGGLANGARQRARTHCKHGHEFTPANTYVTKEGWRNCRECQNAKMRRLNAAKAAKRR